MAATYNGSLDHTTDSGTAYKSAIDNNFSVLAQTGAAFAPHEASTPNMTVQIDPGYIFRNGVLIVQDSVQTSGTITAPSVNPRIDLIEIASSGYMSVVTGTEAASPTLPSLTYGSSPVGGIVLAPSTTAITNSLILDLRPAIFTGGSLYNSYNTTSSLASSATQDITITHALGTDDVVVEIMGYGNTTATDWGATAINANGEISKHGIIGITTVAATPSSGDVAVRVQNGTTGSQTITISVRITSFFNI